MASTKQMQARAKAARKQTSAMSDKNAICLMNIKDDDLYKGLTHGAYIRANSIQNAILVGDLAHSLFGVVKVCVAVTHTLDEESMRKFAEAWWKMPENAGPKYFVWLPMNDIKEMVTNGLSKVDEGLKGQFLGHLMEMLDLHGEFKRALVHAVKTNPDLRQAFNNLSRPFGDIISNYKEAAE
jgi:hypothetical protein